MPDDIRAALRGEATTEIRERLEAELKRPDSEGAQAMLGIEAIAENALNVNWRRLLSDESPAPATPPSDMDRLLGPTASDVTMPAPVASPIAVVRSSSGEMRLNLRRVLFAGGIAAGVLIALGLARKIYLQLEETPRAQAAQSQERLATIARAILAYEQEHGQFPASSSRGEDGEPLLSWRVHLLPFLGEDAAKLHAQFRQNEPWDSDHNRTLITQIPKVFRSIPKDESGYTTYLLPVGPGTLFDKKQTHSRQTLLDRASQTVLLVSVRPEYAVPWTRPDDWNLNASRPDQGLVQDAAILVAFADGNVRRLRSNLDRGRLLLLFVPATDKILIDWKELESLNHK